MAEKVAKEEEEEEEDHACFAHAYAHMLSSVRFYSLSLSLSH